MEWGNKMWVELEVQMSAHRVRTYRGLADSAEIRALVSGEPMAYVRLERCYWYNDPDDAGEEGKTLGTYERLGAGPYQNFTGEIFLRTSTVINVALLKAGLEGEPNEALKKSKLLKMVRKPGEDS